MCLDEMPLLKDQTRRPSPKFGLAKAFSQVTSMLLGIDGMTGLWAMYPPESKICRREEVTSVHLEMLHIVSLSAGPLPTRSKMAQALWAVPST